MSESRPGWDLSPLPPEWWRPRFLPHLSPSFVPWPYTSRAKSDSCMRAVRPWTGEPGPVLLGV